MVLVTVVGSKKREVVRERKEQITEQQILKSSYGRSFGIVGQREVKQSTTVNRSTSNTVETATIPCSDEILQNKSILACPHGNTDTRLIHKQTSTSLQQSTNQSGLTVTPVSSRPVSAGSLASLASLASLDSFQLPPSRPSSSRPSSSPPSSSRPSSARKVDITDDEAFFDHHPVPQLPVQAKQCSPEPKFTILVNRIQPKQVRRTSEVGIRLKQPIIQTIETHKPALVSLSNVKQQPSIASSETNSTEENLELDFEDDSSALSQRHVTVCYKLMANSSSGPALRGVKKTHMAASTHVTEPKMTQETTEQLAEKFMQKGLPPFIKWAISSNENYREAMEIWPCNEYVRHSEMAQVTLRPKLNRKVNALSFPDKRGQGVYYNALGGNRKVHRKQIDLVLPREDINFQLERADWFQFFRGEMQMKLEKQYLHDNKYRQHGMERYRSHITVPEARVNPTVC